MFLHWYINASNEVHIWATPVAIVFKVSSQTIHRYCFKYSVVSVQSRREPSETWCLYSAETRAYMYKSCP